MMMELGIQLSRNGFSSELAAVGSEWRNSTTDDQIEVTPIVPKVVYEALPTTGFFYKISMVLLSALALVPLITYFVRRNPSVVVVGLNPLLILGAILISFRRPVVILSVQGLPRNNRLRRLIWKWQVRRSDTLVVPAMEVKDVMKQLGVYSEVRIIQNPVLTHRSVSLAEQKIEHRWLDDPQIKVVLGVGRLTYQKNFSLLIKAFSQLDSHDEARLLILGEGEERSQLERLIQSLGLGERVEMPGFAENPIGFMSRSDVFVLSSRWEGPGHVLIEAMSTGVPCVSVECPGGPIEIMNAGEYGMISEGFDEQSLTKSIAQSLSGSPEILAKAELGKSSTVAYDSIEVGKRYARLANELLENRN
ncbi:glycosyltransferase [Candidatus Lucifugimonas marina]|uniref:glycosyltransferase n=1 Tax=Candidatus Lucifugimonas marina TaxID=3038979 RepID=UPI00319EB174